MKDQSGRPHTPSLVGSNSLPGSNSLVGSSNLVGSSSLVGSSNGLNSSAAEKLAAGSPNLSVLHADPSAKLAHRLAKLPKPIARLRESSQKWLADASDILLARVDDALFDMASSSHHQEDQDNFFFAMRELRNHQRDIAESIQHALDTSFASLADGDLSPMYGTDELSVISNDEMDEILALEVITKQANRKLAQPLAHLKTRMQAICPCEDEAVQVPFSPEAICHYLKEALDKIRLNIKPRLVLIKHLEAHVISLLPAMLADANQLLRDAGILPNLEKQALNGASGQQSNSTTHRPAKHQSRAREDKGLMGEMVTLDDGDFTAKPPQCGQPAAITEQDRRHHGAPQSSFEQLQPGSSSPHELLNTLAGAAVPQEQLAQFMASLEQIQKRPSSRSHVPGSSLSVSNLLGNQAPDGQAHHPNQSGNVLSQLQALAPQLCENFQYGRQTVELVDGLFENLTHNEDLSSDFRQLMGDLRLPMARLALTDKDFFIDQNHDARRLVNALTLEAMKWQPGNNADAQGRNNSTQSALFKKMQSIVERISGADNDADIYTTLGNEFDDFVQREKRRLAIVEKRLLDAEEGRHRSENAHMTVAKAITQAADGCDIKPIVSECIHGVWHQVMYIHLLRSGSESAEWKGALQALINLIVTTQSDQTAVEWHASADVRKHVLAAVKEGMALVAFDPFEAEQVITKLSELYRKLVPAEDDAAANASVDALSQASNRAAALRAQLEQRLENIATLRDEMRDDQGDADLRGINEQAVTLAQSLPRGAWLDYREDIDAQKALRCRLAAILQSSRRYIFVDCSGHKVLEKKLSEVAQALDSGQLALIESHGIFDNALQAVIAGLRKKDSLRASQ